MTNGRTFRLNVWDFGGQQIYHATHQFFLTQRSLYVLLDDTRSSECPRSYENVSVLELIEGIGTPDQPEPRVVRRIRPLRIFLASSSELRKDRDKFELAFLQLNDELVQEGFHLEIVRCEYFLDAISSTRLQDEYNEEIRVCDVFVSLFFTKAGKFTNEELDVAYGQFKGTGRPLIYTYIKDAPVRTREWPKEDHDSIDTLRKKLNALGHYPTDYTSIDNLINQFRSQLGKIREKLRG